MMPDWKIEVFPDQNGIVRVATVTATGVAAKAAEELSRVIYTALGSYTPRSEKR